MAILVSSYDATGYKGVLRREHQVIWKCEHEHPTDQEAQDCADKKLAELTGGLAPGPVEPAGVTG